MIRIAMLGAGRVGQVHAASIASQAGAVWKEESRFPASVAKITFGGSSVHLIKPLTFMNDSGSPLAAFLRFHRIELSELVVLHDDIASLLAVAGLRLQIANMDHPDAAERLAEIAEALEASASLT